MQQVATSYVYKDYGASYFEYFDIEFEAEITQSQSSGHVVLCTVSNTIGSWIAWDAANDGIMIDTYNTSGTFYTRLRDHSNSNQDTYSWGATTTLPLTYYKFERLETTATLKIYSDASRTILIDTLTITCETESKRYIYCLSSRDGGSTTTISGTAQNFEIVTHSSSSSISSSSISSSSTSYEPYENLLAYTKVDSADDITIVPLKCTFTTMRRDAVSYVYYDYGAGYFGNFKIEFEVKIDAGTQWGNVVLFGVANTLGTFQDIIDASEGMVFWSYNNNNSLRFTLTDYANIPGDIYTDYGTSSLLLYLTVKRNGTTLTADIYSDSVRETLIDALSVTCVTETKRYFYALTSRDSDTTVGDFQTGYTQNFEIIYASSSSSSVSSSSVSSSSSSLSSSSSSSSSSLSSSSSSSSTSSSSSSTSSSSLSSSSTSSSSSSISSSSSSSSNSSSSSSTVPSSGGIDQYTKLMLHMDGDQSGSQIILTSYGDPNFDSVIKKFNGSMYFDGNDRLQGSDSSDLTSSISTGDFTVDYWIRWSTITSSNIRIVSWGYTGSGTQDTVAFGYRGDLGGHPISFSYRDGQTWVDVYSDDISSYLQENTFHHFAIVRDSGTVRFFLDGIARGTSANASNLSSCTGRITIGASGKDGGDYPPGPDEYFIGWAEEIRISDTARWTTGFTPPSAAYTTDANTKLLLHMNGDVSPSAHSVTVNGNTQLNAVTTKWNGAMYFDGSGDFLSTPDHEDWDFTAGDYTIDLWVKHDGPGAHEGYVAHRQDSTHVWYLGNEPASGMYWLMYNDGVAVIIENQGNGITDTNWHHVALVKAADVYKIYVDGIEVGTTTDSSLPTFTGPLYIGKVDTGIYEFAGYIDELRISKGIARWTTNFTPPTSPYF